ncbi:hypothetical protein [Thiomonas intermedia]|uniref:hypothetical protein n=1 Tax=Thiomonas intermedia TaxID=926 RepID=UPI0009A4B12C|nr:hypothetical protein [Thiomonas intermedia]
MFFLRSSVNYALVGERDGCAGREPPPHLWRRTDYRSGYARGLLERAQRVADADLLRALLLLLAPGALDVARAIASSALNRARGVRQ